MKLRIGENIKFLRKAADITQETLAEMLGVSCQSVSRWELGTCYPDMELLLYFVLPIKIKWMAYVYAAYILYDFVQGNWITRTAIAASLLNFILFFLSSRNIQPYTPKEQARKRKFKKQTRPHMTYANGAMHRCAVCGKTELDDPTLEFRFCSKCKGNYEYCQEHLFTHEHVK